jgi:pimeloyl-ACP methyl ester carboxylesterase
MASRLRTNRIPGLVLTDHEFSVPLDHSQPNGERISVYARELVVPENENAELPWLVYFQGGPGFGAPRPTENNGWMRRALQEYRVLLLDQRGTGRSTSVTAQTMSRFSSAQDQADYLKHFRADSIVQDAELIRAELLGPDSTWSVLGQSFGGFCVVRYLSAAPGGLKEAFVTGGLPSLTRPTDDVYRATYQRVLAKNEEYYRRYPDDVQLAREIVDYLDGNEVILPSGDRLTSRRFEQLGLAFGGSEGFERTHYLLEDAFVEMPSGRELSYPFLRNVENGFSFQTNPIFAVLHEAIYCQNDASNWSAGRLRDEHPAFDSSLGKRVNFTGEMIYPWMFEEYGQLRPLRDAAETLAAYDGWPRLYDVDVLKTNTVPCAAIAYYNDMYVERLYSEETAAAIGNLSLWVTSEYEHNGLRADGEKILGRLIDMVRGR